MLATLFLYHIYNESEVGVQRKEEKGKRGKRKKKKGKMEKIKNVMDI